MRRKTSKQEDLLLWRRSCRSLKIIENQCSKKKRGQTALCVEKSRKDYRSDTMESKATARLLRGPYNDEYRRSGIIESLSTSSPMYDVQIEAAHQLAKARQNQDWRQWGQSIKQALYRSRYRVKSLDNGRRPFSFKAQVSSFDGLYLFETPNKKKSATFYFSIHIKLFRD